jgi:hypothetical protein
MRRLKKELWPHRIIIDQDESCTKIIEIENWLGERFGQFKERWNVVYQHNRSDFYFRDSKDSVMFTLRWL